MTETHKVVPRKVYQNMYGHVESGRQPWMYLSEGGWLAPMSNWTHQKFTGRCGGCFKTLWLQEMVVDGMDLVAYDRLKCASDRCVGLYGRMKGLLSWTCSSIFLAMIELNLSFVHNASEADT